MSFLFRSSSSSTTSTDPPAPPSSSVATNASSTDTSSSSLTSAVTPTSTSTTNPPPQAPTPSPAPTQRDAFFSTPRARKQFLVFSSGLAFLTLSTLLTRRHIRRRFQPPSSTLTTNTTRIPPLHTSKSIHPPTPATPTTTSPATPTTPASAASTASEAPPQSSSLDALEALQLASLNVLAFAVTLVGGLSWAYDISTLDELRRKVRGGMGVDGTGRGEQDVEEEFEEWVVSVLARKETKERMRRVGDMEEGGGEKGGQWRVVDEKGRDRTI